MQQRTASLTQSRLLADLGVAAGIAVATTLSAQVSVGWPIPTTLETFRMCPDFCFRICGRTAWHICISPNTLVS